MAEKIIYDIQVKTGKAVTSVKKLDKEIDKTSNKTKGIGSKLSGGFKGLGKAIGGAIPMLGKLRVALISTGIGAIAVALGSLAALFASAASKGANFGKAVSDLKAISGGTEKELKALTNQAKQLGSSTQFTASQVVGLQTELAKLGFVAGEIRNATPSILALAGSLDVDLADAAAFAGAQINAFGLDASETQRIVDVMALSAISSAQDFETLRESFGKVAPAANAVGASVEQTATYLGILADSNIKGSEAGTALKNTFIEIAKKGITLEESLKRINSAAEGPEKLLTAIEIAGKRGGPALLTLAKKADDIDELTQSFEKAGDTVEYAGQQFDGVADKLLFIRNDNLQGDVKALSSAWEGFLLGIEDGGGTLNELQRGGVQLLTDGIVVLRGVIDLLAFTFVDTWSQIKLLTSSSVDILVGGFNYLGGAIKKFANEVMLSLADVPFIGKAIDVGAVQSRLKEAEKQLSDSNERIKEGTTKFNKWKVNESTKSARFAMEQAKRNANVVIAQEKKEKEATKKILDKANEEKIKASEKAAKEEAKALEEIRKGLIVGEEAERAEKLRKIEKDYEKRIELAKKYQSEDTQLLLDLEAAKKAKLDEQQLIFDEKDKAKREKDKADLAKEKADEQQKEYDDNSLRLENAVNDFESQRTLLAEQRQLILDDETISAQERIRMLRENSNASIDIAQREADAKRLVLGQAAQALALFGDLAGKETAKGKALATAGALINTYKGISEIWGAKAEGTATTTLLSKIAASAVVGIQGFKAVQSINNVKVPGGGGGGSVTRPAAPTFNVVGQSPNSISNAQQVSDNQIENNNNNPQRAYVVSTDITNQQSLDRDIEDSNSLG